MSVADRIIDATARRPSGWLARKTYGGPSGAPKGHEAVFDQVLDAAGSLEGARCLEVGCGGGRLLERVLCSGVVGAAGLDHSPDMLALSRERNREAVERGVLELKLGDATQLLWADGAFTIVLLANTFFFFERPELVLAELHRVLSPGGRLVIGTVPGPLPAPSLRNWWVWVWGSRMHAYDDETMRSMLDAAGFTEIKVTRPSPAAQPLQLVCAISPRVGLIATPTKLGKLQSEGGKLSDVL
jgi:SAM-dependent methyltransferase